MIGTEQMSLGDVSGRRQSMERRSFLALAAGAPAYLVDARARAGETPAWPAIKEMLFGRREIVDGTGLITLTAPARAHDAAVVPMTIAADGSSDRDPIAKLWLVIDKNPAPVAGVFDVSSLGGRAVIETRVRVNEYTPVHLVGETAEKKLYAVESFVKAAGGCSAPGLKDPELALARLGKMKLRQLSGFAPREPFKVQVLISHPNYTGLQIDQLSRNWIPPDYVQKIKVAFSGRPLIEVEADISLSEDPSLTFAFVPESAGELSVQVTDSKGREFHQTWSLAESS
jgi:sulfur-oxidizing protein SoxY